MPILLPTRGIVRPRGFIRPTGAKLQIDLSHPFSKGLLGYWPLNNSNGGRATDLVTGNDGLILAGPTGLVPSHHGGTAISLNGTSQAIASFKRTYFGIKAWTVCAWGWKNTTGAMDIATQYNGSNQAVFFFRVGGGGAGFSQAGGFHSVVVPEPGTGWHFHVLRYDFINNLTYFLDGVKTAETTGTGALTPDNAGNVTDFNIAQLSSAGAEFWNGSLADVKYYGRAVSDADIKGMYSEPFGGVFSSGSYISIIDSNFGTGGGGGPVLGAGRNRNFPALSTNRLSPLQSGRIFPTA